MSSSCDSCRIFASIPKIPKIVSIIPKILLGIPSEISSRILPRVVSLGIPAEITSGSSPAIA